MAKFWENMKQKISGGTKPLKEKTVTISKNVGEKTQEVTESVIKTSKEFASTISGKAPEVTDKTKKIISSVAEKTGEAVTYSKLKYKGYTLNRDLEKGLSELGGRTFEMIKQKQNDIYQDAEVLELIEKVKRMKAEAELIRKQIGDQGAGEKGPMPEETS